MDDRHFNITKIILKKHQWTPHIEPIPMFTASKTMYKLFILFHP